ncbi:MAG: protein kinase [Myxococcota bacterium]
MAESEERLVGGVYRLERRIGAGAMGVVYAARHVVTEAEVALKLLHPHLADASLNVARFEREVSVAARVGHPGIVRVFDAGLDPEDQSLFVAMELLRGCGLEAWLRRPGVTLADAVGILRAVCEPLAAAHAHGIIHRDLKPDNVFVEEGPEGPQVKLLDFGIARDLGQNSLTGTHAGLGTPHYMAPEQATDARGVSQSADVWSVGVMLYWYAKGELPFDGDGPFDTVLKAMTATHRCLQPEEASPALIELVESCLSKTPDQRPNDGAALATALDDVIAAGELDRTLPPARLRSHDTLQHPSESEGAIGDAAKSLLAKARAAARGDPTPDLESGDLPGIPLPWPGSGDDRPKPRTPSLAETPPHVSSVVLSGVAGAVETPPARPASVPPVSPPEPPRRRRWGLPLLTAGVAALVLGGALLRRSPEPVSAPRSSAPMPPAPKQAQPTPPPPLEPSVSGVALKDEAEAPARQEPPPMTPPSRVAPSRRAPRRPAAAPKSEPADAAAAETVVAENPPDVPISPESEPEEREPEVASAPEPAVGSEDARPVDEATEEAHAEVEATPPAATPKERKPESPPPKAPSARAKAEPPNDKKKAPEATDFVTF